MQDLPLTFHVDVVSAEGAIFSGIASMLVAPTVTGEVGILARHAPLLARLKAGVVRVMLGGVKQGEEETFFISGGFLEVQPQSATILADTTLRTKDMDEAAARAAVTRIEKEMGGRQLPKVEYDRLKAELNMMVMLLRSIDRLPKKGKPSR
jgi:F-type H+-transporting ATPase subunit epsilon